MPTFPTQPPQSDSDGVAKKASDKKPSDTVKKVLKGKVKGKKSDGFIQINPPTADPDPYMESLHERAQTKVDYLIRSGLGNKDKITYYRQVLMDPKKAVSNPMLRPYLADVLDLLLKLVIDDTQSYNRLITNLHKTVSEEGGAGDVGTDELANKYRNDTPGQQIIASIKKVVRKGPADV